MGTQKKISPYRSLESCRLPLKTDADKARDNETPRFSLMKQEDAKEGQAQPKGKKSCRLSLKTDADKSRDNKTLCFPMMKEGDSKGDLSLPED